MKVLIADDDHVSRRLLQTMLEKWGYEVVAVADGLQAMEILIRDQSVFCAILDWMMPGMEGIDICLRIRHSQEERILYIILLTAKGEGADIVAGLAAGADDYIAKPFEAPELRHRVLAGERIIHLEQAVREKNHELENQIRDVWRLQNLLPICSRCGKPRHDATYLAEVAHYLESHRDELAAGGLCEECRLKFDNDTPVEKDIVLKDNI